MKTYARYGQGHYCEYAAKETETGFEASGEVYHGWAKETMTQPGEWKQVSPLSVTGATMEELETNLIYELRRY